MNYSSLILTEKTVVWWVPHALTDTRNQTCLKIVQVHLKRFRMGENFLNPVIVIDKTWIWDFKPE